MTASAPAAIPPEAVQVAATAMRRSQCHACAADLRTCDCIPDEYDLELARAALEAAEAAWPHEPAELIAAAERERIVAVALRDIASFVVANEAGYTADLQPFVDLIRKGFPDAM